MSDATIELIQYWGFWGVIWGVIWGAVGLFVRGKNGNGFWWGFFLGAFGVIVVAILRTCDSRAPAPADRALASTRLAHLARPAPARRVTLIRRPAPVEIVPCGHCAGSINVAGVSGRFACPHCQGSLEV